MLMVDTKGLLDGLQNAPHLADGSIAQTRNETGQPSAAPVQVRRSRSSGGDHLRHVRRLLDLVEVHVVGPATPWEPA